MRRIPLFPAIRVATAGLALLVSTFALPAAGLPGGEQSDDEFSFALGMAHGCIDAQRRLHAEQGRAFNLEAVRNVCYCMAGQLVERFREKGFQARADAGEATAVAAVNAIESTCEERVSAGRRFAP
jgi:hypothetical protein